MNQEMERALREALARKNPRPGFADRVMARLPEVQSPGGSGSGNGNHSLLLDIVVLFETVGVVLTGKGAR